MQSYLFSSSWWKKIEILLFYSIVQMWFLFVCGMLCYGEKGQSSAKRSSCTKVQSETLINCTAVNENVLNSVFAHLRLKIPPYCFVPPCFSFTPQKGCVLMILPPERPSFHLGKWISRNMHGLRHSQLPLDWLVQNLSRSSSWLTWDVSLKMDNFKPWWLSLRT